MGREQVRQLSTSAGAHGGDSSVRAGSRDSEASPDSEGEAHESPFDARERAADPSGRAPGVGDGMNARCGVTKGT